MKKTETMVGSEPTNSRHLPWLDWVRFLAAFVVLQGHARGLVYGAYGDVDSEQRGILVFIFFLFTRIEHEAVIVFFVLSGFLVGGRLIERLGTGGFRLKDYIIDRVVRIYLPLIPALVLTAIVAMFVKGSVRWSEGLAAIGGLNGVLCGHFGDNVPLWSLAYEIWFYVLGAGLACIVLEQTSSRIGLFVVVVGCLIFTKLQAAFLFLWVLGGIAWVRRPAKFSWGAFLFSILLVLYSMGSIQVSQATLSVSDNVLESLANIFVLSRPDGEFILGVGFILFLQQIILVPARGYVGFLDRLGASLAAFSYTLYLTHFPVLSFLKATWINKPVPLEREGAVVYLVVIAVCICVAWCLFYLFERRTGDFRRWLRRKLMGTSKNPDCGRY